MDKVLSYNQKSNGEDWFSLTGQYNEDDIKAIKDPNGGQAENPKTAIPSPFAQLDLVKNAFEHIAKDPRLLGSRMDMRLVSYALDIAQMFYNFDEMKSMYGVQLVEWNMSHLQMLLNDESHRRRPDAPVIMEGWDFFLTWHPDEVKQLLKALDPGYAIVWDFTADDAVGFVRRPGIPMHNVFTGWGVTNAFPYSFGVTLAHNRGMDIRGQYDAILFEPVNPDALGAAAAACTTR